MELGQDGRAARTQDLDRGLDRRESVGRSSGTDAGPRVDEEQERPEDRRRPQLPVEADPAPDVGEAFVEPAELDLCGAQQARCRSPSRSGTRARRRARRSPTARSCASCGVASPEAKEARVEAGVRRGERMLQLDREGQRRVRPLDRPVRVAQEPQREPGGREARDPWVVADPRRPRPGRLGRGTGRSPGRSGRALRGGRRRTSAWCPRGGARR